MIDTKKSDIMKLKLLAITLLAALAVVGCKEDEGGVANNSFTLSSDDADMSGGKLTLNSGQHTIAIDVLTEDETGKWSVRSPIEDLWLSYSRKEGQLIIEIDSNDQSRATRTSWVEVSLGDNKRRIVVEQDFFRRLAFADSDMTIGASADNDLSFPYSGNIDTEELTVTTDPVVSWVRDLKIAEGVVTGIVQRNPSYDDLRSVDIILSGGNMETTLTLTQNQLSHPYAIDLSGATFTDALIYEIWDEEHNIKIGELCKEYLRKYDATSTADIVNMSAVVAYPMLKNGGAALANGFVVTNGGSVAWNTNITSSTLASDYITSYVRGGLVRPATKIYRGEGDINFTATALEGVPEDEIVKTVLKPYIVTDTRTGAENTANETTETYTYKVVKVGTQYWMAENLKTSRLRDGSPIPTGIANADWSIAGGSKAYSPGCLLTDVDNGTGGITSNVDVNSTAPTAVESRNKFGIQYNWHAVVNKSGTASIAMTGSFEDMLSPEGWSVPTKEEFERVIYYVAQPTAWGSVPDVPDTGSWRAKGLYLPQVTGLGTNETGLSMDGAKRFRNRTGGFTSNNCNYWTMSGYSFSAQDPTADVTAHVATSFSIYPTLGSESYTFKTLFYVDGPYASTQNALNVRCIRK
jgi:uncharacterized protein (TIGR02145 family)